MNYSESTWRNIGFQTQGAPENGLLGWTGILAFSRKDAVVRRGLRAPSARQGTNSAGWPRTPERWRTVAPISQGSGLPESSRGDQDGLEVHDERAAVIVDGRADGFEQTVSDYWFEGGVIAP